MTKSRKQSEVELCGNDSLEARAHQPNVLLCLRQGKLLCDIKLVREYLGWNVEGYCQFNIVVTFNANFDQVSAKFTGVGYAPKVNPLAPQGAKPRRVYYVFLTYPDNYSTSTLGLM